MPQAKVQLNVSRSRRRPFCLAALLGGLGLYTVVYTSFQVGRSTDESSAIVDSSLWDQIIAYYADVGAVFSPENERRMNYAKPSSSSQPLPHHSASSSSICAWAAAQSPIHLWMQHLPEILAASRLASIDEQYALESVTASVLRVVTERLPRSVKALPVTGNMSRIMAKLEARYRYLLNHPTSGGAAFADDDDEAPPPPVTITVLGGSVTMGVNCHTGISQLSDWRCAWPARLEQFIDALVQRTLLASGADKNNVGLLVAVRTMAVGGTNTATGQELIEYDLLDEVPDILINAYSTNDMHILTLKEAAASNLTLRDKVFTMAQDFVRTLYRQQHCSNQTTPLLFWLDDYVGNEQRGILATQQLAQSIQVLANYYGFGFVSYADAVRDVVYSNTMETMFSPAGWYNESGLTASADASAAKFMQREIHPGQGMHMATSWMMAYNLISTMTLHCNMESFQEKLKLSKVNRDNVPDFMRSAQSIRRTAAFLSEDTTKRIQMFAPAPPGPRLTVLPPPLTSNLTLDVVTEAWQQAADIAPDCKSRSYQGSKRCPVSWVSGLPWTNATMIKEYFQQIVRPPYEWDVLDYSFKKNKLGWMPLTGISQPKLVMEFGAEDHVADNIRSITLFFLKSYGLRWRRSVVHVMIERKVLGKWMPAVGAPTVLTGYHDKNSSETYTETVNLLPLEAAATMVRVTLKCVGGKRFKLTGIAVCQ